MLERGLLNEGATIVCESAEEDVFANHEALSGQFEIRRRAKYGAAYVTVLQYGKEDNDEQ
jgi:16S rRNA G966 N2-methylase RsmD